MGDEMSASVEDVKQEKLVWNQPPATVLQISKSHSIHVTSHLDWHVGSNSLRLRVCV